MRFQSGKHEGKSYEEVLLKDPADAHWFSINGHHAVAKEFQKLIKRFDEKPMTTPCEKCSNSATKATGFDGGTGLKMLFYCENGDDPWFDEADPPEGPNSPLWSPMHPFELEGLPGQARAKGAHSGRPPWSCPAFPG